MRPADRILDRLLKESFNQFVLCNTERGMYVEYMIQDALGDAWELTGTWDSWDLDRAADRARIEVKQSAALVNWGGGAPSELTKSPARFDIKPHKKIWRGDRVVTHDVPIRPADLYIFAWHGIEAPPPAADQRDPAQWQFYVVHETDLPNQDRLALRPLTRLSPAYRHQQLPQAVADALQRHPLKADAEPLEPER